MKLLLPLLLAATPVFAHAMLAASSPADKAAVKSPQQIKLTFSENLEPAFSGAALADASGKAMPVPAAVGGSAITLLPMSLRPGAYTVTWHSVGRDTHRMNGHFTFKVIP
jgi:methionine-rich copper-binding protein CopC